MLNIAGVVAADAALQGFRRGHRRYYEFARW
jgi:hypothetical protein